LQSQNFSANSDIVQQMCAPSTLTMMECLGVRKNIFEDFPTPNPSDGLKHKKKLNNFSSFFHIYVNQQVSFCCKIGFTLLFHLGVVWAWFVKEVTIHQERLQTYLMEK